MCQFYVCCVCFLVQRADSVCEKAKNDCFITQLTENTGMVNISEYDV